jgi:hypothetical protein
MNNYYFQLMSGAGRPLKDGAGRPLKDGAGRPRPYRLRAFS